MNLSGERGKVSKSMFRYPGGKSKLKRKILEIIRTYYRRNYCYDSCRYVEPFIGGGAIARELFTTMDKIAINDFDIGISAFWHSVINNPDELCYFIRNFYPTVDSFYKFKNILMDENLKDKILVEKKYSFIYIGFIKMACHQMSFSGLGVMSGSPLGGNLQKSKYKIDCRWNPSNIIKNIKKYHNQLHEREKDIFQKTCEHDDFESFINRVLLQSDENFIYLDPPYYEKGPELYQFSFNEKDHCRLSNMLKNIQCPWLLSYDACEEIKDLYGWAKIIKIDINCTINTKNGARNKKEFLIMSKKNVDLLNQHLYL